MLTLPDPKHESFATLRASGHDVASAYIHAGYSVKNVKSRARKLVRNPNIQARIEHLKTCLPRITELHERYCPTLRLMPETRHEMFVWLWQVMNGTRLVKPAQMRAAGLYCRMRGWHLAKQRPEDEFIPAPAPASVSTPDSARDRLTDAEEVVLAMFSVENIEHERTGTLIPQQKLAQFQSLMADQAHACLRTTPIGILIPEPIPDPATETPALQTPASLSHPPDPMPSPSPITVGVHEVASQNPLPENPSLDSTESVPESPQTAPLSPAVPSLRPVSPVRPVLTSPPAESPPKSPSQPPVPQRLTFIPSPTPHQMLSPTFAPLPRLVLPPKNHRPHPLPPAHRLPRRQPHLTH